MSRFIIAYSWHSDVDVIEAANLEAAEMEAARRSMAAGLLDDDLADTTWAENYTDDLAHDLGLLVYAEPHSQIEAYDRANRPPWR